MFHPPRRKTVGILQSQEAPQATPDSADFRSGFPWELEPFEFTQVVAGLDGDYFVYESVVFGGGGSPMIWGRGAAFLGRSGQSLFETTELCLELFVDDPWSIWAGTRAKRRRNMVVLLLWWVCVGLDLAWKKLELGRRVRWIGADIEVLGKEAVRLSIPAKYCTELATHASVLLANKTIDAFDLRRFAGRCSWAGGIVPCVASVLQPCWAALADVDLRAHVSSSSTSSHSWQPPARSSRTSSTTAGSVTVPTVRVAHALEWIREFARGQSGAITKTYTVEHRRRPISVVITTDASPWGYGGFVMVKGRCMGYFVEAVTAEDIARFAITIGDAKHQALLENLALLIAVRLWSASWVGQRLAVGLRSDSMAALQAWRKERSCVPAINAITREMSLDLAEGLYKVDALEHIPGKLNEWADALSRQHMPGNTAPIPAGLLATKKCTPAVRNSGWWRLEARPSECIGEASVAPGSG
jgi:hypothetical protein